MSNKASSVKKNATAAANKAGRKGSAAISQARGQSSGSPVDKAMAWLKDLWAKVSKR